MVLIFTTEPERFYATGQGEPADRPVIAPVPSPGRQGIVLRQMLAAYVGRELDNGTGIRYR